MPYYGGVPYNSYGSSTAIRDDLYQYCQGSIIGGGDNSANDGGTNDTTLITPDEMLRCYSLQLSPEVGSRSFARSVVLVLAAALVFFMQAGFAMLCAGAVRKKNVQNTMLKNLLDACGASIAFFSVGYAFAFGGMDPNSAEKTFVGTSNFFLKDVDDYAFWLFEYAFSAASATVVAGTLAERCQMAAYLCYSVVLAGWVYPIIAHAVWNPNGFLAAKSVAPLWGVGMVDFAGSGVVHMTGGVTALFATIILGPRKGRFHDDTGRKLQTPKDFPGHSVALQMLGTFILWFGWYGFNSGSALLDVDRLTIADAGQVASLAGVNTTLSGGMAGMVGLFVNLFLLERYTGEPYYDLRYLMNGSLSGLVAITGGCGVMEPWAAVVTGFVAGLLYIGGSRLLLWLRLDDCVDAIPCHLVNGAWGLISVGLFASPARLHVVYGRSDHPGWVYSALRGDYANARLLGVQLLGILFILGWVMVIMLPFFVWLDWKGWFRSDPLEEIVGLDTSYHGGLALLVETEEINPEYITAYKKRKKEGTLRQRGTGGGGGRMDNRSHAAMSDTFTPESARNDDDEEENDGVLADQDDDDLDLSTRESRHAGTWREQREECHPALVAREDDRTIEDLEKGVRKQQQQQQGPRFVSPSTTSATTSASVVTLNSYHKELLSPSTLAVREGHVKLEEQEKTQRGEGKLFH